jgi:hypothetical protein
MQAAGRGAASAARTDVTDFRRSDEDRAGERRHDAADRAGARSHRSNSIPVLDLEAESRVRMPNRKFGIRTMAEWRSGEFRSDGRPPHVARPLQKQPAPQQAAGREWNLTDAFSSRLATATRARQTGEAEERESARGRSGAGQREVEVGLDTAEGGATGLKT